MDVNLEKPKATALAGQPKNPKGGLPGGGNKRPRDESHYQASRNQGAPKGALKGGKGHKGGATGGKRNNLWGRGRSL